MVAEVPGGGRWESGTIGPWKGSNLMTRTAMFSGCLALSGLAIGVAAEAQEVVVPETVPVALHRDAESAGGPARVDTTIEASGVEPIGDGRLVLIAHDKSEELYVAEAATGRIVGEPLRCEAFPKTPKWEGMARDDRGNYYLIGAHTAKTAGNPEVAGPDDPVPPQGVGDLGRPVRDRRGVGEALEAPRLARLGPGPRAGRRQEAQDRGPGRLHPPRRSRPPRTARAGRRPAQPGRPRPRLHRRHQRATRPPTPS